jgi:hypothetical protein
MEVTFIPVFHNWYSMLVSIVAGLRVVIVAYPSHYVEGEDEDGDGDGDVFRFHSMTAAKRIGTACTDVTQSGLVRLRTCAGDGDGDGGGDETHDAHRTTRQDEGRRRM